AAGVAQVAAPAGAGAGARAVEVETAQLHALAEIPDAVERRLVALVGGRQLVERTHVRRNRAGVRSQRRRDRLAGVERRDERAGDVADAAVILEPRQRVGRVRLPVVAEPLGVGVLPPVVV